MFAVLPGHMKSGLVDQLQRIAAFAPWNSLVCSAAEVLPALLQIHPYGRHPYGRLSALSSEARRGGKDS